MRGLLDFAQGASNAAAGAVAGPIDLINMGLLGAGLPMPQNPFGGSQWMRERGLMRDPQNRTAGLLGESVGGILPIVAAARAPQIAAGLLQAGDNLRAPTPFNAATRGQGGAIVYHGSPHRFPPEPGAPLGKFRADKIGTGEGAQVYGHGHYTSDARGVASTYRDMDHPALGKDPRDAITAIRQNWQTHTNPRHLSDKEVRYLMQDFPELAAHLDSPDIVKNVARVVNGQESGGAVSSEAIYAMRALDKMLPPKPTGSLYKVDLPDEHIARMLDWDKPLSQQPANVQRLAKVRHRDMDAEQALIEKAQSLGVPVTTLPEYVKLEKLMDKARKQTNITGFDLYERFGGGVAGAEKLRQAGIPGIRYLDGGSRTAGGGTSNYVVFPGNENLLKILGRE